MRHSRAGADDSDGLLRFARDVVTLYRIQPAPIPIERLATFTGMIGRRGPVEVGRVNRGTDPWTRSRRRVQNDGAVRRITW